MTKRRANWNPKKAKQYKNRKRSETARQEQTKALEEATVSICDQSNNGQSTSTDTARSQPQITTESTVQTSDYDIDTGSCMIDLTSSSSSGGDQIEISEDLYHDIFVEEQFPKFMHICKEGPDYVCTCCERKLFAGGCCLYIESKFPNFIRKAVVRQVKSVRDKVWICYPCENKMKAGEVPPQSTFNSLALEDQPDCLKNLNSLERNLISTRIGFRKIVQCKSGKQQKMLGQVINIPTNIDRVCTELPRLPRRQELYRAELKRSLEYKSYYMRDYVDIGKLVAALHFLKENNHYYSSIQICGEKLDLLHRLKLPDITEKQEIDLDVIFEHFVNDKVSAMSKFLPDFLTSDFEWLNKYLVDNKLVPVEVPFDIDSLYNAVCLAIQDEDMTPERLKKNVLSYLRSIHETSSVYPKYIALIPSNGIISSDVLNTKVQLWNTKRCTKNQWTNTDIRQDLLWKSYIRQTGKCLPAAIIELNAISDLFALNFHVKTDSGDIHIVNEGNSTTQRVELVMLGSDYFISLNHVSDAIMNELKHTLERVNDQELGEEFCDQKASSSVHGETEMSNINEQMSINPGDKHECDQAEDCLIDESEDTTLFSVSNLPEDLDCDEEYEPPVLTAATIIQKQNLTIDDRTLIFAPGEGYKPKSILADTYFEVKANPDKFPSGNGGYHGVNRKLTMKQYIKQRLENVDSRFRLDLDYIFTSQYAVEAEQLLDNINIALRQVKGRKIDGQTIDAKFIADPDNRELLVKYNLAYKIFSSVRGSSCYWDSCYRSCTAMIRQLSIPSWFITLSAAETRWPEFLQILARENNISLTELETTNLSWTEKCKLIAGDPITTARYFDHRTKGLFNHVLQQKNSPVGEVIDYFYRVEYQMRGSAHIHSVQWVADAPNFNVSSDEDIISFVDRYQVCTLPKNDLEFQKLVKKRMTHVHNSTCTTFKNTCRFEFPKFLLKETIVIRNDHDHKSSSSAEYKVMLSKFKDNIKGSKDLSIDEFISRLGVDYDRYVYLIKDNFKGKGVMIKRQLDEIWINNYNEDLLKLWRANMDIQFVCDPYACMKYITSYMLKPERSMSNMLKSIIKESTDENVRSLSKTMASAYCMNREVSAQEAAYRALSLPLKMSSRVTVFVDSKVESKRCALVKEKDAIAQLPEGSEDVYIKNILDYYPMRSKQFEDTCLATIAADYRFDGIKHGVAVFIRRTKSAILRYYRPDPVEDSASYIQSSLILYIPWRDEKKFDISLQGLTELFNQHQTEILRVQQRFQKIDEDFMIKLMNTFESQLESTFNENDDMQVISEIVSHEIPEMKAPRTSNVYTSRKTLHDSQVKCISDGEYKKRYRNLNDEQKALIDYARWWCIRYVYCVKNNISFNPFHICVTGSAGVGKTYCIEMIVHDFKKILPMSGRYEPGQELALLSAFTGSASYNMGGNTIHTNYSVQGNKRIYEPLGSIRLSDLKRRIEYVALGVIDEISLVGPILFMYINKRLQQVKDSGENVPFGGVNMLITGDFLQLSPVGNDFCFTKLDASIEPAYSDIWSKCFHLHQLTKIVRQKETDFINLLQRVRIGEQTPQDIKILEGRTICYIHSFQPLKHLHVYATNKQVDDHNDEMLELIKSTGKRPYVTLCKSYDKNTRKQRIIPRELCEGAPIFLTYNVDTTDGLTNGCRGFIKKFILKDGEMCAMLIKFENSNVGLHYKGKHLWAREYPDCVPIYKKSYSDFNVKDGESILRTEEHFPLTLGWATTFHKVQGLTLSSVVISLKIPPNSRFKELGPGQAYVGISRVRKLSDLFFEHFDEKQFIANFAAESEVLKLPRLNTSVIYPSGSFTLKCIALNVRFLGTHMEDLKYFLNNTPNLNCLFAGISECHLNVPSSSLITLSDTYTIVCGHNKEGEVINALVIKNAEVLSTVHKRGIIAKGRSSIDLFQIHRKDDSIILCLVVYKDRNESFEDFMSDLKMFVNEMCTMTKVQYVLGDFNIHKSSKDYLEMLQYFTECGYKNSPADYTTIYGTTIDYIFERSTRQRLRREVMHTSFSDHLAVIAKVL